MHRASAVKKTMCTALILAAIVAACAYVSARWFRLMLIRGDSMLPAYHNMQIVVLDRHSREYRRGDVIAFHCEGFKAVLVKRIAACGGDRVQIAEGTLFVNGEASPLYEKGAFDRAGCLEEEIRPAQGEYVVIGDNTAESRDSRDEAVGTIRAEEIIGKVIG